jgi:hypothetical protein
MFFTYFDVYNLRDIVADEHHPIQISDEQATIGLQQAARKDSLW